MKTQPAIFKSKRALFALATLALLSLAGATADQVFEHGRRLQETEVTQQTVEDENGVLTTTTTTTTYDEEGEAHTTTSVSKQYPEDYEGPRDNEGNTTQADQTNTNVKSTNSETSSETGTRTSHEDKNEEPAAESDEEEAPKKVKGPPKKKVYPPEMQLIEPRPRQFTNSTGSNHEPCGGAERGPAHYLAEPGSRAFI